MRIHKSDYPISFFSNGHFQTIWPSLTRQVKGVTYIRERISTPDDDFIDLDWINNGTEKLVIICHGLEGNTTRPYIMGMAKQFSEANFDVLTWNYRGCGDEMNLQKRFYHSGATDDLATVIEHALKRSFRSISLVGFSLGGNVVLKYLGETGDDTKISAGVAISVPLHLHHSSIELNKWKNIVYATRFLLSLKQKVKKKARIMPDKISTEHLKRVRNLYDFDDYYTAPLHGFKNALDYYHKCSAYFYLEKISKPVLIINAKNDSFLSKESFPEPGDFHNQNLNFEFPSQGGHCGFPAKTDGQYWLEKRTQNFIVNIND